MALKGLKQSLVSGFPQIKVSRASSREFRLKIIYSVRTMSRKSSFSYHLIHTHAYQGRRQTILFGKYCAYTKLMIPDWTKYIYPPFAFHQFIFSNDKFFKNCLSIRKTVLMFFKTFSDLQHFLFKFEKYAFLVFLDKYVPFFLFFVSWNCFVQEFVSHCDLIITASLRLLFMDDSWVGHVNLFFNKAFVFRIKDRSLVIFSNYQPG